MNHPGIAKVLDGGATPAGRPYFAMEFVKGRPITEFCDRQKLGIADRLRLFEQACEAIQHAHLKGIVHRDITPRNILAFQLEGEEPKLKVIDFGLAKAMGPRLGDRSLHTQSTWAVGTPAYMSPEQANPGSSDIDTRSDIYSLGVLLYELLAGVTPIDVREVNLEVLRELAERDPPAPSVRLSGIMSSDRVLASRIEASRGVKSQDLVRRLRGELEWIPLKAMRKERQHRYQTALEFANDVRAYLDGRPLLAGPESTAYRVRKYVRRNRALVAGAGAVLAALVVGLGLATWQWAEARREARESASVLAVVASAMEACDPLNERGGVSLEGAMRAVIREVRTDADLSAEARLRLSFIAGSILIMSSDPEDSRQGFEILEDSLGSADFMDGPPTVERLEELGALCGRAVVSGRIKDKSHPLIAVLLDWNDALYGNAVSPIAAHVLATLDEEGDPAKALETLDCSLSSGLPADESTMSAIALTRAEMLAKLHRWDEATLIAEAELAKVRGRATGWRLAWNLNGLASTLWAANRFAEAKPLLEEALKGYEASLGSGHSSTVQCRFNIASTMAKLGDSDGAQKLNDEVIIALRPMRDERSTQALGMALALQGRLHRDGKRYDQARVSYGECLEVRRRYLPPTSPYIAGSLNDLALTALLSGRCEEALPLAKESIGIFSGAIGEDNPSTGYSACTAARIAVCLGDAEAARRFVSIAAKSIDSMPAAHPWRVELDGVRGALGTPPNPEAPASSPLSVP
jgi:non-specific serine/threonine protein kinase/serine/threonine-protein kinase